MRRPIHAVAALALLVLAGEARAEDLSACATFAWPLDAVRNALVADVPEVVTGAMAPATFELALEPMGAVKFPTPPARKPKHEGTSGGFATVAAPSAKLLQVSLSDEAWIDAVQDGRLLKTAAFSGRQGCPGLRKSVRFEGATAAPITLQISGSDDPCGCEGRGVAAPARYAARPDGLPDVVRLRPGFVFGGVARASSVTPKARRTLTTVENSGFPSADNAR
jgi:hypothetical protein